MIRSISILGATGSVGLQAADVAEKHGLKVDFLSAATDYKSMEHLARRLRPAKIAMADIAAAEELRCRLADTSISVLEGEAGIIEGIASSPSDTFINAIIGTAGLKPTLAVIEKGARLGLANKESLVIAGEHVMARAADRKTEIIPVDSEHCAIFQSLKSGNPCEIKRILLTASGGAFYGYTRDELRHVTLSGALAHPTWQMGRKITVDCATLMNKGFEIIEAAHLFGVREDQIKVLIHRESILHSAVEFVDNSIIGEMSLPDMRSCIEYAISYPARLPGVTSVLELDVIGSLTFAAPDIETFPLLGLARRALRDGGACSALLNGADEVAAAAFLDGKIPFTAIQKIVTDTYESFSDAKYATGLEDMLRFNTASIGRAEELVKHFIQ